jgi:hypothetical protein
VLRRVLTGIKLDEDLGNISGQTAIGKPRDKLARRQVKEEREKLKQIRTGNEGLGLAAVSVEPPGTLASHGHSLVLVHALSRHSPYLI